MTARENQPGWQIAECLLPGLTLSAAEDLARRIATELASQPRPGVCFLGSLLMPGDEVLLCLFAGPEAEVAAVSEQVGLPFERILACVGVGWPAGGPDDLQPPVSARMPPASPQMTTKRKEPRCESTAPRASIPGGSRTR